MACPKPEFLYFDLGNVILRFERMRACQQMAAVSGVPAEWILHEFIDGPLQIALESGQMDTDGFFQEFCRMTGTHPNLGEWLHAYSDMFEVDEIIVQFIQELRAAGFRTGILSNTCQAHWEFCTRQLCPKLLTLCDAVALSYEVGVMKPHPRIYFAAAQAARTNASGIFFTDDRPENVLGAAEAGFDAVHYTSFEDLRSELAARGIVT